MVRKHIPTVEGKSGPDGGLISVDIDNDFVYYYRTIVLILLLRVLVTLPQPISQTWELTIPIPHWILVFFYIEGGLLITFEVMISAHQSAELNNMFTVEIIFRWHQNILYLHLIEESRTILGYLWPNPYYQIDKEEIRHAPSRVSLATGVTASEFPTHVNSPEPSPQIGTTSSNFN